MADVDLHRPRHRKPETGSAPWSVVPKRSETAPPQRLPLLLEDLIDAFGGASGRHVNPAARGWWTPQRAMLVTALVFLACGFLTKANCIQGGVGENGLIQLNWSGNRQFVSACYTDAIPAYEPGANFAHYLSFPVVTAGILWLLSLFTGLLYPAVSGIPGVPPLPEVGLFFILVALVLAGAWVWCVWMLADLLPGLPGVGYLIAASPIVAVHAFSNVDLLAVAASISMVWFVQRERFAVAGVFLGIGVAVKLWPVVLLLPVVLVAVRERTKLRAVMLLVAATAGTWLVLNLPLIMATPQQWARFYQQLGARSAEWTSIYAIVARSAIPGTGIFGSPMALNVMNFGALVVAAVIVVVLALRASSTPSLAELCFVTLALFLLVNKVWSPQYSLWLLPFAVLVFAPRWWKYWYLLLGWAVVEVLVWLLVMWHMLGEENLGIPHQFLDVMLVVRALIIVGLVLACVREWNAKKVKTNA